MSGRCRSCNTVLTDQEMCFQCPDTDEYTEMCFRCLSLSEADEDLFDPIFDEWEEDD